MNGWIETRRLLPREDEIVETKIDDDRGCRNEQNLKRRKNLWWHPDGSMYVYYTPTHWRSQSSGRCDWSCHD